jgi:trehalose 6-phosphate phosphatase
MAGQGASAAAQNDEADAPQRDWELMHGHCVFELKQRRISKGTALRAFMAEAPFAGRVPIYAGDDVTDEDGIEAAQALGGWGVRVGPGATAARYRLADVDAVARWLGANVSADVLSFDAGGRAARVVPSGSTTESASEPEGQA